MAGIAVQFLLILSFKVTFKAVWMDVYTGPAHINRWPRSVCAFYKLCFPLLPPVEHKCVARLNSTFKSFNKVFIYQTTVNASSYMDVQLHGNAGKHLDHLLQINFVLSKSSGSPYSKL